MFGPEQKSQNSGPCHSLWPTIWLYIWPYIVWFSVFERFFITLIRSFYFRSFLFKACHFFGLFSLIYSAFLIRPSVFLPYVMIHILLYVDILICFWNCICTKLSQNVCLINTHILIYQNSRCNCMLWNIPWFCCLFKGIFPHNWRLFMSELLYLHQDFTNCVPYQYTHYFLKFHLKPFHPKTPPHIFFIYFPFRRIKNQFQHSYSPALFSIFHVEYTLNRFEYFKGKYFSFHFPIFI